VCTAIVSSRGTFLVDGSARGEDFYLATSADFPLAMREDFFMAMDTGVRSSPPLSSAKTAAVLSSVSSKRAKTPGSWRYRRRTVTVAYQRERPPRRRLERRWLGVTRRFDAYARIPHPAEGPRSGERPVR
jgi:hypothetical protein